MFNTTWEEIELMADELNEFIQAKTWADKETRYFNIDTKFGEENLKLIVLWENFPQYKDIFNKRKVIDFNFKLWEVIKPEVMKYEKIKEIHFPFRIRRKIIIGGKIHFKVHGVSENECLSMFTK